MPKGEPVSQLIPEDVTDRPLPYRVHVVEALANFRREWQKLAEGENLTEVDAPISLVLADIADYLELNPQERHVMLGGQLINQVDSLRENVLTQSCPRDHAGRDCSQHNSSRYK